MVAGTSILYFDSSNVLGTTMMIVAAGATMMIVAVGTTMCAAVGVATTTTQPAQYAVFWRIMKVMVTVLETRKPYWRMKAPSHGPIQSFLIHPCKTIYKTPLVIKPY